MTNARCEPPEHLRGKSGWHWLSYNGKPYQEPIWWEADPDHWDNPSGTWRGMVGGRPDWARDNGWSYFSPVPSPEDVRALVEAARRAAIGGNHLGLVIGENHPPHTASHETALAHYGAGPAYEIWCAWAAIYPLADALAAFPEEAHDH